MKHSFSIFTALFVILFSVLLPLAVLGAEPKNDGGGRSYISTFSSRTKDGGRDEVSAEFAAEYDSDSCKKEAVVPIIVFAHDEEGKVVSADVYVDDNKIGTAPGSFYVPICSFKLMLKAKNQYFYKKLELHKDVSTFINATIKPELQWSKKAAKVKSPENYCKNLKEDGRNDWRLPTIDDFKTVIKCPGKLNGGDCEFLIRSYKSLKKSGTETKWVTQEDELWSSQDKGAKISFLKENEAFAAASPDCPFSENYVMIKKAENGETSAYFQSVCLMNGSKQKKESVYSVRCVRN